MLWCNSKVSMNSVSTSSSVLFPLLTSGCMLELYFSLKSVMVRMPSPLKSSVLKALSTICYLNRLRGPFTTLTNSLKLITPSPLISNDLKRLSMSLGLMSTPRSLIAFVNSYWSRVPELLSSMILKLRARPIRLPLPL